MSANDTPLMRAVQKCLDLLTTLNLDSTPTAKTLDAALEAERKQRETPDWWWCGLCGRISRGTTSHITRRGLTHRSLPAPLCPGINWRPLYAGPVRED